MSHGYDWRTALTAEERRAIAKRGPIACRPTADSIDDVVPCRQCHCWLLPAFKHARTEKIHARRRDRLQNLNNPHGVTDGAPHTIYASGPAGSKPGTDWLLAALKQVHPDRDPHPEIDPQWEKEEVDG